MKNGKWICADPDLAVYITHLNREVEESSDYYPNFDAALAVNVLKHIGGEITYETEYRYVEGRVY